MLSIYPRFVLKLCAIVPEMEPQEVPPFVYQLLFLCYQSDHLIPLQHLAKYFESKLKRCDQKASSSNFRGDSMGIDCEIGNLSLIYLLFLFTLFNGLSILHVFRRNWISQGNFAS